MTKFSIILLVFFMAFCSSNKRTYNIKPTKSIVNPDNELLEANAVAYHLNDTLTQVYLQIINENLVYKRADTTTAFYAEVKVFYKLLADEYSKKIIDSGSYFLVDRAEDKVVEKGLNSKFKIKCKEGSNYYLEVFIFDLNKKIKHLKAISINKKDKLNEQNFLVTCNNNVAYKTNFLAGQEVEIKTSHTNFSSFYVDCFKKEFGPALPPFSLKPTDPYKYKPDSSFAITPSSNIINLKMPERGFYHIRLKDYSNEGLTLFTYDETYPGVSNSAEMINCTRYIMNKQEFEECKSATDSKASIDKFWIALAGSNDRAKELLKRYYGRVKEANKYYASYAEGWKSDRGMIYIIYGKPTNVYKNYNSETWVYGIETNPASIRYIFKKAENPFSNNDFILERSQFFKDAWYTAVDYWRQGRVYTSALHER